MSVNDDLKQLGSDLGFSVAVFGNKDDTVNFQRSKEIASKFSEFVKFCRDQDCELASGMEDFNGLGNCSYLAVKSPDDKLLLVVLTPHDLIDLEEGYAADEEG